MKGIVWPRDTPEAWEPERNEQTDHVWEPTTNTHAVWQCRACGLIGFSPHPLPTGPCLRGNTT